MALAAAELEQNQLALKNVQSRYQRMQVLIETGNAAGDDLLRVAQDLAVAQQMCVCFCALSRYFRRSPANYTVTRTLVVAASPTELGQASDGGSGWYQRLEALEQRQQADEQQRRA